jgi:TonB family protein
MKHLVATCFLFTLINGKAQSYCKDTTVNYKFAASSVHYPQTALEAGIQGEVIVSFDVDSTCTLINRQVIKGLGHGCDQEALKSINEAEKKLKMDNKSKCCSFNNIEVPVNFKIE